MSEQELKIKRRELGIRIFRSFTRELIMNSGPVYIAKLQTIIEKDRDMLHEREHRPKLKLQELKIQKETKLKERLKEQQLRNHILKRQEERQVLEQRRNIAFEQLRLNVPETRLPERFAYLKPVPVEEKEEFGNKIDMLLQDPNVEAIECPGENEELVVRGIMGEQKTEMKLSKKEIDDLINKFSELTKIPVTEGIYKVVFGKLILLAVVSEVVGSKFLIKKMKKPQPGQAPRAPLPNFAPPQPLPNNQR